MQGSKKPYGRGAIAPGATFARARTCSSLVIRLDAIVNLRWLCEKRDSGGRGKPRLVVTGNFQHRETGVEAGGRRRGFFSSSGQSQTSKNVTADAARDLFSRISRILLTRKQSDFSPVPVLPVTRRDAWTIRRREKEKSEHVPIGGGTAVIPCRHERTRFVRRELAGSF